MSSRSTMLVMASLVLLLMSVPLLNVQAEDDPWRFLTDFALVPESPALIEGHYIAALFVSQDKKELAVVISTPFAIPAIVKSIIAPPTRYSTDRARTSVVTSTPAIQNFSS